MRILSAVEMDAVFGGDGTVAPTLPTVNVTATSINDGSAFDIGGGWGNFSSPTEGTYIPGCGFGCAYNMLRPAIASPPSADHLRCVVNADAAPGFSMPSNYSLTVVDAYGFFTGTSPNGPGGTGVSTSACSGGSAGQSPLYGLTETSPPAAPHQIHSTQIFAGGMVPHADSIYYTNPQTSQNGIFPGPFTAVEWEIASLAHEAAHENGIVSEQQAWYYGYIAVQNHRWGHDKACQ